MGRNLIVFDFDWSFVDQDTDRWVFEVLSTPLRRRLQDRKSSGTGMQCTPDVVYVWRALSSDETELSTYLQERYDERFV
jgi:hypothetical protein